MTTAILLEVPTFPLGRKFVELYPYEGFAKAPASLDVSGDASIYVSIDE